MKTMNYSLYYHHLIILSPFDIETHSPSLAAATQNQTMMQVRRSPVTLNQKMNLVTWAIQYLENLWDKHTHFRSKAAYAHLKTIQKTMSLSTKFWLPVELTIHHRNSTTSSIKEKTYRKWSTKFWYTVKSIFWSTIPSSQIAKFWLPVELIQNVIHLGNTPHALLIHNYQYKSATRRITQTSWKMSTTNKLHLTSVNKTTTLQWSSMTNSLTALNSHNINDVLVHSLASIEHE